MTTPWGTATLALYVISLGLYAVLLYSNQRHLGRAATTSLLAALAFHYLALLDRAKQLQAVPYQDLYGSISLFAWLLAVTYAGLEAFHRQRSVGPFVLPFVIAALLGVALLQPETPPAKPQVGGAMFALHVTLNVLSYAAFGIAFVLSAIYLLQNRLLRDHRLGTVFWRFPALEVLDRMSRSSVLVGVVALGVGLTLGSVLSRSLYGRFFTGDAKEIISLLILLLYLAYAGLARSTQWRGARAARLCVFNFFLVVFSYTVVNFYLSRFHRYF